MTNPEGLPPNYPFRPELEVTPRQVKAMRDAGEDFVFIDCRTPREYEVARIEGATLLPLQELAARIDELDELGDKKIVVTCHLGGRSMQMTLLLRQRGLSNVYSMAGGINLWSLDIDPTVPRY